MSQENTTFKIESMHTPRYTFNLVLQHPWVYALGGRTYGSDEVGVLNTCERYQLEEFKIQIQDFKKYLEKYI